MIALGNNIIPITSISNIEVAEHGDITIHYQNNKLSLNKIESKSFLDHFGLSTSKGTSKNTINDENDEEMFKLADFKHERYSVNYVVPTSTNYKDLWFYYSAVNKKQLSLRDAVLLFNNTDTRYYLHNQESIICKVVICRVRNELNADSIYNNSVLYETDFVKPEEDEIDNDRMVAYDENGMNKIVKLRPKCPFTWKSNKKHFKCSCNLLIHRKDSRHICECGDAHYYGDDCDDCDDDPNQP